MNEISQPVETKLGVFTQSRSALWLDFLDYDIQKNTLNLCGTLDLVDSFTAGNRVRKQEQQGFYSVTFRGVMAFSVLELDSWLQLNGDRESLSSFDEILNSRWQAQMMTAGKITLQHKHFAFVTYDDVIDVICDGYEMNFRKTV